ncbi:MATE family efflux transporter [Myxococcota bacterium]|nr:MATE family efflux transporter [Myxococcota bacterium]
MESVSTRSLLALALPAAASAILNNAFRVIDQASVRWLGTAAQAAIGSCAFVTITLFACFVLVSAGAGPLIARCTGAGDAEGRRQIFGNALLGGVLVGCIVQGALILLAPSVATWLGLGGEVARLATAYLRTLAVVVVPLALAPLVDAALVAMGHTRTMLALQAGASLLNGLLNGLLIYGFGLGIEGAALATGLAHGLAVAAGLALLWRRLGFRGARIGSFLRPGPALRRVLRVGLPISLNTAAYALVYQALLRVAVSPLGPEVNAALGIGFSGLESVSWPLFWGISLAVASVVGRSLGAGRPDLAQEAIRRALPLTLGTGLAVALAFHLLARPLCALFTDDPVVLAHAVLYARVLAWSQPFVALEALAEGVLEGAGDTRAVLRWSLPLNMLRVPLGAGLAQGLGWGAAGIWWAINLTTVAKALGKGSAVWRGRWRWIVV